MTPHDGGKRPMDERRWLADKFDNLGAWLTTVETVKEMTGGTRSI
jgi:hypothetical protein